MSDVAASTNPHSHSSSSASTDDGRPRSRRAGVIALLVLLVVAVLLALWLLRGCESDPEAPFDYFRAKADELGNDAARVTAFVETDIVTLPYTGTIKGALGALWDGAGSKQEKYLLLEALLRHCRGTDPLNPDIDIDSAVKPDQPPASLAITHRLLLADGTTRNTEVVSLTVPEFVGDVHSIEVPEAGVTRITRRGYAHDGETTDVPTADENAVGEQVVFTLELPGGTKKTVTRELWHADNRVGPTCPLVGDRHDFVVLPCRVSEYVREKEELRLQQLGREEADAPEVAGYLALLDYCRESDDLLTGLEEHEGVRALFDEPRILIRSVFNLPEHVGGPCIALDLRHNLVTFTPSGDDAVAHYAAVQTRSFVEAGLEHDWLERHTGRPCTSAWDVFNRLVDDYPNTADRRLARMSEAARLARDGSGLTEVEFRASDADDAPAVRVTARTDGWRVIAPPANADIVTKLNEANATPGVPLTADGVDVVVKSADSVALLAEVSLMAAARPDGNPTPPDYRLVTRIHRAADSLVTDGARFRFAWGEGDDRVDQRITVAGAGADRLSLEWRIQSGVRPAAGRRHLSGDAVDDATTHNPWYRIGTTNQTDATSFVVSRHVHAELAAGRPVPFALQAKFTDQHDPQAARPVDWSGTLEPVGHGTHTVTINRQPATLDIIHCRAGELEVAILDDPRWPVGMADKLTEVHTTIRARVVDVHGVGISGATVQIGVPDDGDDSDDGPTAEPPELPAALDGSFRIPPRATADGYARLRAVVKRDGVVLGVTEIDLTAPGLDVVTITVPRPLREVVYVTPETRERLDALPVSAQVKRHAEAVLDAGRHVVIPDSMLPIGADAETVAFFAFHPPSGEIIGVTEDGLHGSSQSQGDAWKEAGKSAAGSALGAGSDLKDGVSVIHVYRGSLTAWWVYAMYRLEGDTNAEAVTRMLQDMDAWEAATNFFSQVESGLGGGTVGGKAREKLAGMMGGGNIDGDAAALAFKIGFMGSAAFLGSYMEGR